MKEISLNQIFKSTNDLKEGDQLFTDNKSNKKYFNLRYITSLDSKVGTALKTLQARWCQLQRPHCR